MEDALKIVDGSGGFDYLVRSLAIVTMLYERGILQELVESGRITPEEIENRIIIIREKYPILAGINPSSQDENEE